MNRQLVVSGALKVWLGWARERDYAPVIVTTFPIMVCVAGVQDTRVGGLPLVESRCLQDRVGTSTCGDDKHECSCVSIDGRGLDNLCASHVVNADICRTGSGGEKHVRGHECLMTSLFDLGQVFSIID
jgi:hypothetical protein